MSRISDKKAFIAGPMAFDRIGSDWVERHTGAKITAIENGKWTLARGDDAALDQDGRAIIFDRPKDAATFAVFLWGKLIT
jgi:hypothetical protein